MTNLTECPKRPKASETDVRSLSETSGGSIDPGRTDIRTDITADQHLADARLHLQRATLAIKSESASRAQPDLVVRLGTPHALLVEALALLEQVNHA